MKPTVISGGSGDNHPPAATGNQPPQPNSNQHPPQDANSREFPHFQVRLGRIKMILQRISYFSSESNLSNHIKCAYVCIKYAEKILKPT